MPCPLLTSVTTRLNHAGLSGPTREEKTLADVPPELLYPIFPYVPRRELLGLRTLSKFFSAMVDDYMYFASLEDWKHRIKSSDGHLITRKKLAKAEVRALALWWRC